MKNLHTRLTPLLTEAKQLLVAGFEGKVDHRQKLVNQDTVSIVTTTDMLLDNFFREKLSHVFPEYGFISEELDDTKLREYNWIIDPIDGTLNFARKIPIFGISIALWRGNEPVYGFVSLPFVNVEVYAAKGQGMYLNGRKTVPADHNLSHDPYLYFAHTGNRHEKAKLLSMLTTHYNLPRSVGCAIFIGAMTSLGNTDATIYINQGLWDIAAVWAIAKEAGIAYEFLSPLPDLAKNNYRGYQHSLIIGKPDLVKKLATDIKSIIK